MSKNNFIILNKDLLLKELDVNRILPWLLEEKVVDGGQYLEVDFLMDFSGRDNDYAKELLVIILKYKTDEELAKFRQVLEQHQSELAAKLMHTGVEELQGKGVQIQLSTESSVYDAADAAKCKVLKIESAKAYAGQPISVPFLHLAILGGRDTGKTSLLKSLLDELNEEGEPSTLGAQQGLYQAWINNGQWKAIKNDPEDCVKKLMTHAIAAASRPSRSPASARRASSPSSERLEPLGAPVLPDAKSINSCSPKPPSKSPVYSIFDEIIVEVNILCTDVSYDVTGKDATFALVSAYDFAGQQLCQCIQPLLMTPQTAFVLTFDSSKQFTDPILRDTMRLDDGSVFVPLVHDDTHRGAMLAWLDMLVLEVGKEKMSCCRALLAGCKEDIRKGSVRSPKHTIPEMLDGTKYDDVFEDEVFLIDNLKSGPDSSRKDPGVTRLREVLNEKCHHQEEIRANWLRFTMAIMLLRKRHKVPWISYAQAEYVALKVYAILAKDSLDGLLYYQHRMGQLAFFDTERLKKNVIIDVQYVLDAVYAFLEPVLTKKYGNSFPSGDERDHFRQGILTHRVAVYLLKQKFPKDREPDKDKYFDDKEHVDYLLSLMEELLVLVEVPGDGLDSNLRAKCDRFFLLPSITQEEEIGAAEPLSPPICLQLAKVDHFPVYLYWQLIVGLLKETRQQHRRPAYSRFSVREALIPWDVNRLQWLRIQYCWQGLLLRIEQRIGRSGEVKWPLDVGMGTKALKTVVQCLESVRPKSGSAGDVKLSFLCLCGDDSAVCYHHGVHHGKDNDSCEHVASIGSLDTLRKECHDSVDCDSPRCRNKPAFVCPDALKFWLGRSQGEYLQLVPWSEEVFEGQQNTATPPGSSTNSFCDSKEAGSASLPAGMEKTSQIRQENPWNRQEFRNHYSRLLEEMEPLHMRSECFELLALTKSQLSELKELKKSQHHNERLLIMLMNGGRKSFVKFRKALRSYELPDTFVEILEDLDEIGPDPQFKDGVSAQPATVRAAPLPVLQPAKKQLSPPSTPKQEVSKQPVSPSTPILVRPPENSQPPPALQVPQPENRQPPPPTTPQASIPENSQPAPPTTAEVPQAESSQPASTTSPQISHPENSQTPPPTTAQVPQPENSRPASPTSAQVSQPENSQPASPTTPHVSQPENSLVSEPAHSPQQKKCCSCCCLC